MLRWLSALTLGLWAAVVSAGSLPLVGAGLPVAAVVVVACPYGAGAADGCAAASATNTFQLSSFFTSSSYALQSSQTYQSASFTGVISGGVLTTSAETGTVHVNDTLTGSGVPAGIVVASTAGGSSWNLTYGGVIAPGLNIPSQSMATLTRPSWNAACVDYACGPDLSAVPGAALRDPNTIASGHCAWSATNGSTGNGLVSCSSDGGAGIDLNGYDFSLHGCTYLTIASTVTGPIVIRNSKFIVGGASSFNGTISSGNLTINSGLQGVPVIGQYITGSGIPTGTTLVSGSGTSWVTSASSTTTAAEAMTTGMGSCGMVGIFKTVNIAGGSTVDIKNNYLDGCVLLTGVTNAVTDCPAASWMGGINSNFIVISGAPTGKITLGPYNVLLNTSRAIAYSGNRDFEGKFNYAELTGNLAAHGEVMLLNYPGNLNTTTPISNFNWLYNTFLEPAVPTAQQVTAPVSIYEGAAGVSQALINTGTISGAGTLLTVTGTCTGTIHAGANATFSTGSAYVVYNIVSFGTGTGCAGTYNVTGPNVSVSGSALVGFPSFNNVDIEGNTIVMNCTALGCGHGNPSVTSGSAVEFAWASPFRSVTLKKNYIDPSGAFKCWNGAEAILALAIADNVNFLTGFNSDASINAWGGFGSGTCTGHG